MPWRGLARQIRHVAPGRIRAYPDAILPVCESIFAGDPTEAHIVQAGNPTHLSGPLYSACTKARRFWRVIEITADPDDPKRTTRVSVKHARQQIATYGRDNPWVKVRVFGEFPPASLNALIGPDEVSAAMKRSYNAREIGTDAAKIIGVDVARFGDDESALAFRQGTQASPSEPIATSIRPNGLASWRAPGRTSARTPASSTTPGVSVQAGSTG